MASNKAVEAKTHHHSPQLSTGEAEKNDKLTTLDVLLAKQTSEVKREIGKLQSQLDGIFLDLDDAAISDLDDVILGIVMKEKLRAVGGVRGVRSVVAHERKVGMGEEAARVKVELEKEKEKEVLRRRVEEMERLFARVEKEKGEMERSLSAAVPGREQSQKDTKARMKTVESLQKRCSEMEGVLAMSKTELGRVEKERKRVEEEKVAVDRRLQGFIKENEQAKIRKAKDLEMEEALASTKAELGRLAMEKRRVEEEKSLCDNKLKDLMKENNLVVANLKKEIDEMSRKKGELEKTRKSTKQEMGKALASAKAELDRLAMEKDRVEEEKGWGDQKHHDLIQENKLVVANLKKEIDELTVKNDELEKTRKTKELEMGKALASTKADLDFVKMEKKMMEEEKSVSDKWLKGFMLENNLLVANLKGEIDEMKRKMGELEKTTKAREVEMEEALASAKVKLDCLEMEKARVEEEKSLDEKKLKNFMRENNLVVANLKKEMDEMTTKKDELEKAWKAKELEMEEALASAKAELDFLKMEKRRVVEERSLSDRKVEDLMTKNNLVVAKFKNEMNEMRGRKDELEQIIKTQELQVSELKISSDNFLKEIQRLQCEVQNKTNEIMERENFFNLRQEEMTKSLDDMNRKLKEAMEGKDKVENMKHNQELKILELDGEAKQLKETLCHLEKLSGDREQEILRLQAENVALQESIVLQNEKEKFLNSQLDRVQTDRDGFQKDTKHLEEIVAELQKSGKDAGNEISRLRDENGTLQKSIVEKNEKERCLELEICGLQETIAILVRQVEELKLMESSLKRSEKQQGEEILRLQEERDAIHRSFNEQFEKEKSLVLQLTELQEAKYVLAKEVEQVKHRLSSLDKPAKDQGKEILRLQSEKDDIEKCFDQELEKGKGLELQLKDSLKDAHGQSQDIRTVMEEQNVADKEMDSKKHEMVSPDKDFAHDNRKGTWAWVSRRACCSV